MWRKSVMFVMIGLLIVGALAALLWLAIGPDVASADRQPAAPPAHGGPDAYGYVYDIVPYNWTDIAATGTRIAFNTPDDAARYMSMPQTFRLYDIGTNGIIVSTNGYASLNNSTVYTACDPTLRQPPQALAPFCADLTVLGGNVYYQSTTFNGHPALVIQYQDVLHKASGLRATFQMILDFADYSITYQYRTMPAGGAASVGIIGSAFNVDDFLMACAGDAACQPTDGLALRFYVAPRPVLALTLTPSDLFAEAGARLVYTLTLHNTGDLAAPVAAMTNSLPVGLDYTGGLATTGGVATYHAAAREVRWQGDLVAGAAVTITYAATLNTADPVYSTAVLTHPLAAAPATALSTPVERWSGPEVVAVPHYFGPTSASARHLAVDAGGAAHLVYGGNGLYYATRSGAGGAWLRETIVTTPTARPALILNAAGLPIIAFAGGGDILLARAEATEAATMNRDAAGWRIETIAAGWAEQIELAQGTDGKLHLLFENNRDLYYMAEGAGGWSAPTQVITSTGCTTYAGFSLALNAANVPYVACAYRPTSGNQRELRLFQGGGAAPWADPEVIAANNEGKYYDSPSLAFAGGEFHLAFTRNTAEVFYGRKTGAAWQINQIAQGGMLYDSYVNLDVRGGFVGVAYTFHNMPGPTYPTDIRLARRPIGGGAWTIEDVESFAPGGNRPYPALALDATGRGHLAYYYGVDDTLRYAAPTASFTFHTVDRAEILRAAALAVGEDATVHLAYLAGGLRYAAHAAGAADWTPQLVLPDADGASLDLTLGPDGAPHAAYAPTNGPLFHASGPAVAACSVASAPVTPQTWVATVVDQPGDLQSYPAVAVDAAGAPHIAYLAVEAAGTVARHAAWGGGAWVTETLAAVGAAAPPPELLIHGGTTYLLYADCSAASTPNVAGPIPLRLATRQTGAWQTQTLDTFRGSCSSGGYADTPVIRLAADDSDRVVAVAEISSLSMRPVTFQRVFQLSLTGQVLAATTVPTSVAIGDATPDLAQRTEPLGLEGGGFSGTAGLVGGRNGGLEYVQYHYSGAKLTTYQITKNGLTYTSASVPVYQKPGGVMTDLAPIHRNGLGRGGGVAAVTETFDWDSRGTGVVYAQITPPRHPVGCQISPKQEFVSPAPTNVPAPADTPTCATHPAGSLPCACGQEAKSVTAVDAPTCCGECKWNFYEWKGTCSGATGTTPSVNAACPATDACDVIAVWHRPLLGVSSTSAQGDYCASKENSAKAAMSFELCASALDDWTVNSLTFQASGSGKDDQEIEKVKLAFDGKTLESKYTADDGTVIFTVGAEITKGQCKSGTLSYTFKQFACPLCDDPVNKAGCKEDKEFSVTLAAANVAATAKSYPRSLVIGEAAGGPLKLQCIKNTTTNKNFYEIQKAVDDGGTQNSHTIQVCPGTYTENVNVTKELTIRSTDGWSQTTVQAASTGDHVFEVKASKTTIQGFTIRGATGNNKAGIYLGSASAALSGEVLADSTANPAAGVSECKVLGNMLQGNRYGVFIVGASKNQIGGTAETERNVISGNNGDGVRISGAGASENKLLGNRIGTNAAGTGSLGNGGSGVWIGDGASRNIIGGLDVTPGAPCANSCNVIAHNVQDGVTVMAGTGNAIQGNSIHSNTKLGIDLGGDGWTRNGKTGGAAPNNWQNYPVITGTLTLADRTVITGSLTAKANTTYRLEFFTNTSCETTGLIQGRELLATAEVTTNADGQAQFRITAPRAVHILTATATDPDGNTSEFSPPDIQVSAIEVTQAIQNLAHEVPLIAEKPTTARVYVRAVGCDAPQVTAVLWGPQGGLNPVNRQPLTAQALAEPQRPTAQERARFDDSLNFNLPRSWIGAGTYTWTAEVNPECQRPDAHCGEANRFQLRNITFRPGGQLTPVLIPIRYVRDGADLKPDQSEFKPYISYLRLYPLAMNPLTCYIDPPVNCSSDLRTPAGWESLLDTLWLSYLLTANPGPNARYYGVVDDLAPVGAVKGIARLPGGLSLGKYKFAAGRADPAYGQWVMIHELAHTFGRLHPGCTADEAQPDPTWPAAYDVCNIGVTGAAGHYGFDYLNQYAIGPEDRADFMTYTFLPNNGGLPVWVSPHTYQGLDEALMRTAAQAAAAPFTSTHGFLAVRGSVSLKTDAGSFDTVYRFSETNLEYAADAGPYTLTLEDAGGGALVSHAFDLRNPHLAADAETARFAELIPFDPRAARLALRRNGNLLAVRNFSAHSPTVTLLYPNGGENVSGVITVRWTASDADGAPLSQIIQLSCDGGATWRGLAVDVPGNSLQVNTNDLPGGQACRFRVLASDGLNTGQDQSDGVFTIGRKPPSALIIAPTDGAAPLAGAALILQGAGSDPEEGPLGDAALSWRDSVSGTLGTGSQFVLPAGLGPGWHTLTLTAADSDGMTGSDSVRVCVGCPQADLKLTKTAAPEPAQTGQPLTYTLIIANAGPDPATGVVLTDTLPASVTVGRVTISQGTCNVAAGVVACNVGQVAAGATITVTVVVTPARPGALINRAVVRCNEGDASSDNTAAVTTEVTGARRLYLPLVLRR